MTDKTEIEQLDPENTLVRVFRYPSAIITNASFNEDGCANTITFYFDASFTSALASKNKRETRWCYYLPKLKEPIRRAIEEGIEVSLVIRRYAMPTPGQQDKDIHDFCEDIIF